MSDTPRTDEEYERLFEIYRNAERFHGPLCCPFENDMRLCRQLERELNAANDRIKRLEEALDTLTCVIGLTPIASNREALREAFDMARSALKAKEAKP